MEFFIICRLCVGFQPPYWKNEQRYFKNFCSTFKAKHIQEVTKAFPTIPSNFRDLIEKRPWVQWTQDRASKLQFLAGPLKVNDALITR